jgi:hypothetical protein
MTEQEWLECTHPASMLMHLDGKATQRKARLFCCACCRRVWNQISTEGLRKAVEIAEDYPDARVERDAAISSDESVLAAVMTDVVDGPADEVAQLTVLGLPRYFGDIDFAFSTAHKAYDAAETEQELTGQRDLIRDIFGNPFYTVAIDPGWLAWNGSAVVKVAQGIYEDRAFDRLRSLADALEKAGCTDRAILDHCRGHGPHVRGCWVVDLLLGKE